MPVFEVEMEAMMETSSETWSAVSALFAVFAAAFADRRLALVLDRGGGQLLGGLVVLRGKLGGEVAEALGCELGQVVGERLGEGVGLPKLAGVVRQGRLRGLLQVAEGGGHVVDVLGAAGGHLVGELHAVLAHTGERVRNVPANPVRDLLQVLVPGRGRLRRRLDLRLRQLRCRSSRRPSSSPSP
jgi:hypothetical protein